MRRLTTVIVAAVLACAVNQARAASELAYGTQAIGNTDEAAYAGSGNASVIAALKGLYTKLGAVVGATTPTAGTTGGATAYFLQPAASDNHATIKAGTGTAYGIVATNNGVATNYLRLYNATTGFNGCNSATGLLTQVAILPSGGISVSFPVGLAFSTGLSICVTSGYATTDTTNATASAMSVTVMYN
jgi:hypothetical protein